jgi:DNA-binding transcriptional MerR regulator
MEKSPEAFRTISEVADLLDTPAHVLRFWESRFPQIRPVKRAGGRRYYRPSDVALLSGIKRLLHGDGLTIRGVQKVLRENGIRHVMALAEGPIALDALDAAVADIEIEAEAEAEEALPVADILPFPEPASGRDAPGMATLPLWSATAGAEERSSAPVKKDAAPVGLIPVETHPDAADPAGPPQTAQEALQDAGRGAGPVVVAAVRKEIDLPDADAVAAAPGLAGSIAARLRARGPDSVQIQHAGLAKAARRLQDLRARMAAADGVGGP